VSHEVNDTNSWDMGLHSVTCHGTGDGDFPPLPQPKVVLHLAAPEGCKAELLIFDSV